ncbi:dihydroxyacetone kinase subunit DhaK [Streptomyces sp. NBC_01304]|uniref:dihydroxyacetone kinase subunit DhaK n=1 Tax=Streptomyces sp. NBC_01304 TaxID=2903818 RepID=UPI002E145B6F|nr:dihydroxyacetone kinase subunit DhaK [Streptomyces sp. NBC_01304]
MKKLINTPDLVVPDALRGMATAHPELSVDAEAQIVTRAGGAVPGKVGVVSGGGAGHEPMQVGFVGRGMLDAAVSGPVFTSPVPDRILEATRAGDSGAGVVHIISNYTGDVLNFLMAAEEAEDEGIKSAQVIVADDVAVKADGTNAGRRGTGAVLLVERLAGALAETGASLAEVAALGQRTNDMSRSYGVALTSCTTPAKGTPNFELGANEIELGIGIHGEPGRERRAVTTAREIVEAMVGAILEDLPEAAGAPVIALINGLGGTPLQELYIMHAELESALSPRGITIARSLVGNYISSLDMAGCTITLCRADEQMLALWDSPIHTPALRWAC